MFGLFQTDIKFIHSSEKYVEYGKRKNASSLGYEAIVRGCTQRILMQNIAESVGLEEMGCHEFTEEAFGKAAMCTCNHEDGCNRSGASSLLPTSLFATAFIGISLLVSL